MCGLVGLAGDLNDSHKKVFRNLLLLDTTRGWDSTGVLRVPSTISAFKTSVAKELGTPYELFTTSTMFDMKNLVLGNSRVLLGHNRYATMGSVDIEGAHPFTFGPIIGAHNGTLKDWSNLSGFHEHTVDSKAIFQTIYERGIKDTWSNFTGAAALTWWDEKEKTLNFIRNNDRPLFAASLNNRKAIIWASEAWMIESALKIAPNLTLDEVEGVQPIRSFEVNKHYQFDLTEDKPVLVKTEKLEPMVDFPPRRNVIGFTNRGPLKSRQVNSGWAKGLAKAGKELIGKTFKITSTFFRSAPEGNFHVVSGVTEDGTYLELFPTTRGEWDEYCEMIGDEEMEGNIYEILHRPRISDNGVLSISTAGVDLQSGYEYTSYVNKNNNSCTRKEAQEDLTNVAYNSCAICDSQLTVDDEYRYVWYGHGAICSDCDSNPELKATMGV